MLGYLVYRSGLVPRWIAMIVFEAAITIHTIVKGFRPSPILDDARYAG